MPQNIHLTSIDTTLKKALVNDPPKIPDEPFFGLLAIRSYLRFAQESRR